MNYKTDNKLRTKSLESNNNIYFREFTLDEKLQTESRYNVPLRLLCRPIQDLTFYAGTSSNPIIVLTTPTATIVLALLK